MFWERDCIFIRCLSKFFRHTCNCHISIYNLRCYVTVLFTVDYILQSQNIHIKPYVKQRFHNTFGTHSHTHTPTPNESHFVYRVYDTYTDSYRTASPLMFSSQRMLLAQFAMDYASNKSRGEKNDFNDMAPRAHTKSID